MQDLKFHRTEKPIFVMMVGLPGSGKSTCSKNITIVDTNGEEHKPTIQSSDALRAELLGDECDQKHNQEVFVELHKRIKADLRGGKDVVYDATNINKKRRAAFVNELRGIKCAKVCVCVMTPYETCLKFNSHRDRNVPENAIRNTYMHWTPPHKSEGFDKVIPVFTYDIEQTKSYDIANLINRLSTIDHENKHHSLTVGNHCAQAAAYILEHSPDNRNLKMASLLHDIGKEFTKTYINSKGENDGQAHYYQHQCVGAYDSMFYLNKAGFKNEDTLYVSNLIYYHMHPYMHWRQSQKLADRNKRMMGEKMFYDIELLHKADVYAHLPAKEFNKTISIEEMMRGEGEIEIER